MDIEAVKWLREAVDKREAGVQHDKRHHERSRCAFDLERERANAWISGLRLDHANAIITLIETQDAEITRLRAALDARDAEIVAWLRACAAGYGSGIGRHVLEIAATAIEAGQYRKENGDGLQSD